MEGHMEEATKTKRTVNRSAAYPGVSLQEAVEATKLLKDNLGAGPYSRESAAHALGYAGVNGASSAKVAACVHFGLLTREGNVYKLADLANQIFIYLTEDEKQAAIRTAVQRPTLYAKLIGDFNGKALPKMLDNILVRNHGITERVAKDAASAFVKSAEFAGILSNGVLSLNRTDETIVAEEDRGGSVISETMQDQREQGFAHPPVQSLATPQQQPAGSLPVKIPGTDVTIVFPLEYAYDLSIGTFKPGIELLAKNIIDRKETTNADGPTTPTEI